MGVRTDIIRASRTQFSKGSKNKDTRIPAQVMAEFEEIKKLKKQISDPENTNYILTKAAAFFSGPSEIKFKMVDVLSFEQHDVGHCCHILKVSRSDYYDWLHHPYF